MSAFYICHNAFKYSIYLLIMKSYSKCVNAVFKCKIKITEKKIKEPVQLLFLTEFNTTCDLC